MTTRPPEDAGERWTSVRGQQFWQPPPMPPGQFQPQVPPEGGGLVSPGGFANPGYAGYPWAGGPPPRTWPSPPVPPRRRKTAYKLIGIALAFAVAVGVVNIAWDLFTPDRTEVPVVENVARGANGLPEGYEWAGDLQEGGDRLICGPVTWELVGDYPRGGATAVAEAVALASQMTGVPIKPVDEVAIPAVEITFEYVPSSDLLAYSDTASADTIGLALTQHTSFGITESQVLLDEPYFVTTLSKNRDEAVLVILHEIGHAFGLGHSDRKDSLMYPYATGNTRIFEEDVAAFLTVVPDCG
ncbi:MAG: matrixin family metalloprotease [Bifidobacteriaceae bacterium]|nr:matrixin family metalloprotease [Bifidobacteriaceae bacterium]